MHVGQKMGDVESKQDPKRKKWVGPVLLLSWMRKSEAKDSQDTQQEKEMDGDKFLFVAFFDLAYENEEHE